MRDKSKQNINILKNSIYTHISQNVLLISVELHYGDIFYELVFKVLLHQLYYHFIIKAVDALEF